MEIVYRAVEAHGALTPAEVTRETDLDPESVYTAMKHLRKQGYLESRGHKHHVTGKGVPQDGRGRRG